MNSASRTRFTYLTELPKQWIRAHSNKKPRRPTTGFQGPDGHGEKIWIWSHRRTEQTLYTFSPQLDGFHDLKQLSFHGKKTKPAKLRKDYWSPMAIIAFPQKQGSVGRSVYQKLRELKHRHEVDWSEDFRHKTPEEYDETDKKAVKNAEEEGRTFNPIRRVKDRMFALNRQKKNTIADMAAILAGQGRGNLVLKEKGNNGDLVPVTVSWANDYDQNYAREWSTNVVHELMSEESKASEIEVDSISEPVSTEATMSEQEVKPLQPQLQ